MRKKRGECKKERKNKPFIFFLLKSPANCVADCRKKSIYLHARGKRALMFKGKKRARPSMLGKRGVLPSLQKKRSGRPVTLHREEGGGGRRPSYRRNPNCFYRGGSSRCPRRGREGDQEQEEGPCSLHLGRGSSRFIWGRKGYKKKKRVRPGNEGGKRNCAEKGGRSSQGAEKNRRVVSEKRKRYTNHQIPVEKGTWIQSKGGGGVFFLGVLCGGGRLRGD